MTAGLSPLEHRLVQTVRFASHQRHLWPILVFFVIVFALWTLLFMYIYMTSSLSPGKMVRNDRRGSQ